MPGLPPKSERPYRSVCCPYCQVELAPLPKAKKACPGCRGTIYVRGAADGFIDLIRKDDLEAWDEADRRRSTAIYERFRAEERAALKAAGFLVGDWPVDVSGESHYQRTLERIAGGRKPEGARHECVARLVREPKNRWDRNAIRVEVAGELVGYVNRDDAPDLQPLMRKLAAQKRPAWVRATITGGWDDGKSRGSFGIVIDDLPTAQEV